MNTTHRHLLPSTGRACWLALAACGLLAAAGASAQGRMETIEECLESGTRLTALPGTAGGTLLARQCLGCETHRLSFGPNTRYFIGKEPVPYARLREAAGAGDLRLYVCYRPDSRILTRLRLVAAANAQ